MSKSSPGEGTKIAQAAKELNVTSVTIRRYLSEFNIETTTDDNGVKVLPAGAMAELQIIRRLKEEGLTNPKVFEHLEERRAKQPQGKIQSRERGKAKEPTPKTVVKAVPRDEEPEEEAEEAPEQPARRASKLSTQDIEPEHEHEGEEHEAGAEDAPQAVAEMAARSKHTLTCQTCGKVFEHMNPRLRDCLDCYRTKRKERRRGGSDKHKNVIQHPVVQQVMAKSEQQHQHQLHQQQNQQQSQQLPPPPQSLPPAAPAAAAGPRTSHIRNYRKAIEETRQITSSLKRRLDRPDLPEGERRWLEQIYAYQLILHQGWRHLSEYKAGSKEQAKDS